MLCPNCESEFKKRKKGGCPVCGAELEIHNGVAFLGNPAQEVVDFFIDKMTERLSKEAGYRIPYRLGKSTPAYKREVRAAWLLLSYANYDVELTKEALGAVIPHTTATTLLFMNDKFLVEMSKAVARRKKEQKRVQQEQKVVNRLSILEEAMK